MSVATKNVAVFGSTGSIGTSALEVIAASDGRLRAVALSAHGKLDRLVGAGAAISARGGSSRPTKRPREPSIGRSCRPGTELLVGPEGLRQVAAAEEVDVVLAASSAVPGLRSTWAALEAKKTVALANKETLVMAGGLVTRLAAERGAQILPVDSEHSAIFQALQAGRHEEVRRIVLTASGGPFRQLSAEQLKQVTVDDALAHPTWDMGPKITIDSATMMNKALGDHRIAVAVRPGGRADRGRDSSAIDRAFVRGIRRWLGHRPAWPAGYEAADSICARVSAPAAGRRPSGWTGRSGGGWSFEPADAERFPALALGHEVARAGGTSGAVLNAANEAAVEAFLEGELHFTEIVPACRSVLEAHHFEPNPTLERLVELDRWARRGSRTVGMCVEEGVRFQVSGVRSILTPDT